MIDWSGLFQIIAIDILLGGDNAVVIALACRDLPEEKKKKAMIWGMAGAVGIRVLLLFFALALLKLPYLKMIAALFLFWIGINLLGGEGREGQAETRDGLFSAVRTIVLADAVMSIDNVIGVAGAAKDSMLLIIIGISVSIPVILWGSRFILKVMDRFPFVILLGAGLIGWVAGEMFASDAALPAKLHALSTAVAAASAVLTALIGKWRQSRRKETPREFAKDYGGDSS